MMLPLRYQAYWRFAGFGLLGLVLAAALVPVGWLWTGRVDTVQWLPGLDKCLHALTFASLAVWFVGQYPRRDYWRIAIGLVIFGLVIELVQGFTGFRTADIRDVGANVAGVFVGIVVASLWLEGWSSAAESWYDSLQKAKVD